jgi:hypothetical protein
VSLGCSVRCPVTNHGVDDEQWAEFVRNHRATSGMVDPIGTEPASGAKGGRRWRPRPKAVFAAAVALGIAGLGVYGLVAAPHPSAPVAVRAPSSAPSSAPTPSATAAAPTGPGVLREFALGRPKPATSTLFDGAMTGHHSHG